MTFDINLSKLPEMTIEALQPQIQQLGQIIDRGGSLQLVVINEEPHIQERVDDSGRSALSTNNIVIDTNAFDKLQARVKASSLPDDLQSKVIAQLLACITPSSDLDKKAEEAALREKDAAMWECIGRQLDSSGGYIYKFKMREEFTDKKHFDEEQGHIFPAVEPSSSNVFKILGSAYTTPYQIGYADQYFNQLGYSMEKNSNGTVFYLPDRDVLMDRWGKVQQERTTFLENSIQQLQECKGDEIYTKWQELSLPDLYPMLYLLNWRGLLKDTADRFYNALSTNPTYKSQLLDIVRTRLVLPDIDIASVDGIASDIEFVSGYLKHDVLLSSGKEFVHDHFSHVMTTVKLIFSMAPQSYTEVKKEMSQLIAQASQRIELVKNSLKSADPKIQSAMRAVFGEQLTEEDISSIQKGIRQLEFTLGIIVDVLASAYQYNRDDLDKNKAGFDNLPSIWRASNIYIYDEQWNKKFPGETRDVDTLEELWSKIRYLSLLSN